MTYHRNRLSKLLALDTRLHQAIEEERRIVAAFDDLADQTERLAAIIEPVEGAPAAAIRAWAVAQGYQVGGHGRIPRHIRDAYHLALTRTA